MNNLMTSPSGLSLDEALRFALDGDALLFVGAGMGRYMQSADGPVPSGEALANLLLGRPEDAGGAPRLDKAAGFVLREGDGAERIFELLSRKLTVEQVDPHLANLYQLPWRRIYTTNYDNGIEVARNSLGRQTSRALDDSIAGVSRSAIIHINGYIKKVSPASIRSELSLTDRSYADRNFERSEWYGVLKRDILASRAVFFVGYSLYDLDITRLLSETETTHKTFLCVSPDTDAIELSSLRDYGVVTPRGVDSVFDALAAVSTDYSGYPSDPVFIALRRLQEPQVIHQSDAVQVLDRQLVFGALPESEVFSGSEAISGLPFVIRRQQELAAIDAAKRGVARDFLITGELASGKSATALSMSEYFLRQGYEIYAVSKGSNLQEELAQLSVIDRNILVVVEGYGDYREDIYQYALQRNAKHRLLMTEQAVLHQFMEPFIYQEIFDNQVFEIVLDQIYHKDAAAFAELVNLSGLWGDRSGSSIASLSNYITGHLEGSLYRLLLEIIESEQVQTRIDNLLRPLFFDNYATRLFVTACVANRIGVQFTISDWVGLFDPAKARRVFSNHKEALEFFLNVDSATVFPRVGLLSYNMLRRVPDKGLLLSALIDMYTNAERLSVSGSIFEEVAQSLTRFNVLEPLLGFDKSGDLILNFYDKIRPVGNTRNNADYWLQLGIASTALDRLEKADDAFVNAYAREKRRKNPRTKKIDNYFSRFQLKKAAAIIDPDEAFQLFVNGTGMIGKQIFMDDNRHYPFKSGRVYADIAAKHYDNWADDQQALFRRETASIRDKAEEWKIQKKIHSVDVDVLIRETTDLLKGINRRYTN